MPANAARKGKRATRTSQKTVKSRGMRRDGWVLSKAKIRVESEWTSSVAGMMAASIEVIMVKMMRIGP